MSARASQPRHRRATAPIGRALAIAFVLITGLASPRPAAAWDPSVTHLGIVDAGLHQSAVHLRWMAGSELTRGLFSALRIEPERLTPSERRFLHTAILRASDATGSRPLGGPGSCPGKEAPTVSQRYCIEDERWQMSAAAWIELGVLAELSPSAREVHHFIDPKNPAAETWSDTKLPRWLLRLRLGRRNGAPLAASINRTSFDGHGLSAVAWLKDPTDVVAPPRLYAHLERAYLDPDPAARAHHLAMALVCVGALLHVAQDLSVPAHARADAGAFFAALSPSPGDRGLPLQELAKTRYGRRDLPLTNDAQAIGRARGTPLVQSLVGHLIGTPEATEIGLGVFTAARFFSESSVPAAAFIEADSDPEAAAATLLADSLLDPIEIAGARLSPWPADRGYLLSATGRPLAAFDTDDAGRIRPYIDTTVYNDQMQVLLPRATATTRSLLDLIFPGWPAIELDRQGRTIEFVLDAEIVEPELLVLHQDTSGKRTIRRRVRLIAGDRNRVTELPTTAGAERIVLVLRAHYPSGDALLWELTLPAEAEEATSAGKVTIAAVPAPYSAPEAAVNAGPSPDDEDDDDAPLLPLDLDDEVSDPADESSEASPPASPPATDSAG